MPPQHSLSLFFLAALGLSGCTAVAPTAARDARRDVAARSGYSLPADTDWGRALAALLSRPLTADTAAALALLNSRELAADFEGIGIAQADWIQAGVLRNPVLGLGLEIPTGPPSATRIQASFMEGFLQVLTLPRRKRIAEQDYLAVRARVLQEAVALVAAVKEQVYELQARAEEAARLSAALELEKAALDLSIRQHEAGNIPDIDVARRRADWAQMEIADQAMAADQQQGLGRLGRLIGLWQSVPVLDPTLPEFPAVDPPADLESAALAGRWDLAAARADLEASRRTLGLAKDYALTGSLDVGAQFERDVTGQKSVGPAAEVTLPVFDQGGAQAARAAAAFRQAALRLEAAEARVRLEVRGALAQLGAARRTEGTYRDELLPAERDLVRLTSQRYNGMLVGAYELISAKQGELAAERGEIRARRDCWAALAELEKSAGGSLNLANPSLPR